MALLVGTAYVMPRDRSQLWATMQGLIRRYDPHRRGIFAMWIGVVPLVQVYDADLIKEITSCVAEVPPAQDSDQVECRTLKCIFSGHLCTVQARQRTRKNHSSTA